MQVYYNYMNVTTDAALKNASESKTLYSSVATTLNAAGVPSSPRPFTR